MSSTAVAIPQVDASDSSKKPRVRLHFLDGIRGLASLDVVICHGALQISDPRASSIFGKLVKLTQTGAAVTAFIALSGYCLMLPVVQSTDRSVDPDTRAGFWPYLGRRARRILPPYYAALALAIMVMLIVGQSNAGSWWRSMWPWSSSGVLVSHLLLLHNFSDNWMYRIDAPMWSVATEWQIYFLFPLLLLPIARKFGGAAAIVIGLVGSLVAVLVATKVGASIVNGHPWYLAVFAMGMLAAMDFRSRRNIPWGGLCLVAAVPFLLIAVFAEKLPYYANWRSFFYYDIVAGLFIMCFLAWAARRSLAEHDGLAPGRSIVLWIFNSAGARWLGGLSYSLYLTHVIIEVLCEIAFRRVSLPPNVRATCFLVTMIVAAVAFAWVFSQAFEKPFLRRREA